MKITGLKWPKRPNRSRLCGPCPMFQIVCNSSDSNHLEKGNVETTENGDHLNSPRVTRDQGRPHRTKPKLSDKEQAAWRKGGSNKEEDKTRQLGSKSLYWSHETFLIWLWSPRERLYVPAGKPVKTCPMHNNSGVRTERVIWTNREREGSTTQWSRYSG